MKTEFLRHAYTWSNHGITGNHLGWGITASSDPKNKRMLRELEKMASGAEPDETGGVQVEELTYSADCGFVKMITVPEDAGEDSRKNKKVYLYQPTGEKAEDPRCYLAPGELWTENGGDAYLAPCSLEEAEKSPEQIFEEMHLKKRLPELLRAVFWCLLEARQSLNMAAPSWEETAFAARSGELIYVIHSLLPKTLQKKAGYVSFTRKPTDRETFYFSGTILGENYLNLDTWETNLFSVPETKLEEYFFTQYAAKILEKDRAFCAAFLEELDGYLRDHAGGGSTLKKLEWIFYVFGQKHGLPALKREDLLPGVPGLCYWAQKEPTLNAVLDAVLPSLHEGHWDAAEQDTYMDILLQGCTRRAMDRICDELDFMLQENFREDRARFEKQLDAIREQNENLYARLAARDAGEDVWQQELFQNSLESFETMSAYAAYFAKRDIQVCDSRKDRMVGAGIDLLNGDIFRQDFYEQFDALAGSLDRQNQWADILKNVVGQMEERADALSDDQLKTACFVEQMLERIEPKTGSGILKHEAEKRQQAEEKRLEESASWRAVSEEESEERKNQEGGNLPDALLLSYPRGFLCGGIFFLFACSLTAGYWQPAAASAGLLAFFILDFYYLLMHKEHKYRFWINLVLCLAEGVVIFLITGVFPSLQGIFIYFVLLGCLAVFLQILNIVREHRRKG